MTTRYPHYLLLLILLPNIAVGQQIFRSIDESGNVTYSSSPREGAVKTKPVEIAPAPPDERVTAAKERVERMKQKAQAIEESRRSAKVDRAAANGSLEVVPNDDFSGTTTAADGRRPNPLKRVPGESRSGGDHPVYHRDKGAGRPPSTQPMPAGRPRRGGR